MRKHIFYTALFLLLTGLLISVSTWLTVRKLISSEIARVHERIDSVMERMMYSGSFPIRHRGSFNSVAFSPDRKYALSGSEDGTMRLVEVSTGCQIRLFSGNREVFTAVAFSPDGKCVLLNGTELYNVTTGDKIRSFGGAGWGVFSPDGKYVLSGGYLTMFSLCEMSTGNEVRRFPEGEDPTHIISACSIALSPDGRYAVSGHMVGEPLRLWDVSTGEKVFSFPGHTGSVNSVAFSPDGKYVLSGSDDKTMRLWEASSGREVRYAPYERVRVQ